MGEGVPVTKNITDIEVQALQARFLHAFRGIGTIKAGLAAITDEDGKMLVVRTTVNRWVKENTHGFRDKMEDAKAEFCDRLEEKAVDLALDLKVGNSPIILLALLNANLPAKYRPNQVVTEDVAKEVLSELRKKRVKAEIREVESEAQKSVVVRLASKS